MLGVKMFIHMGLCENPMIYGNWLGWKLYVVLLLS